MSDKVLVIEGPDAITLRRSANRGTQIRLVVAVGLDATDAEVAPRFAIQGIVQLSGIVLTDGTPGTATIYLELQPDSLQKHQLLSGAPRNMFEIANYRLDRDEAQPGDCWVAPITA
jgi:hypothetical protein